MFFSFLLRLVWLPFVFVHRFHSALIRWIFIRSRIPFIDEQKKRTGKRWRTKNSVIIALRSMKERTRTLLLTLTVLSVERTASRKRDVFWWTFEDKWHVFDEEISVFILFLSSTVKKIRRVALLMDEIDRWFFVNQTEMSFLLWW